MVAGLHHGRWQRAATIHGEPERSLRWRLAVGAGEAEAVEVQNAEFKMQSVVEGWGQGNQMVKGKIIGMRKSESRAIGVRPHPFPLPQERGYVVSPWLMNGSSGN